MVGVDGGGSGCRAVVVDAEGVERARVEGGPVVADGRPDGPAVAEVRRVVELLLERGGLDAPVAALWAGLAGAGRRGARDPVEEGLRALGLARRVRVGTDVAVAFHDAFGAGPGILLVAGTGSVGRGRGPDGRIARAGGWGPTLGDEGSGYALGLAGLRAVVRALDGRGPATALLKTLVQALDLPRLSEEGVGSGEEDAPGEGLAHRILVWVGRSSRDRVAGLAPRVAEAAGAGDAVATELVDRAVAELVRHATALEARLGPWDDAPGVALAGGLLVPGRALRAPVGRALGDRGLEVLPGSPDAARGAAALARGLAAGAAGPDA